MANTPIRPGSSVDVFEISRCCAEAQADGVPCPTLGRACEVCEKAIRDVVFDPQREPIRPTGSD